MLIVNIFKQSLSELSRTSGLVTRGGGDTNRWRGIETSRRKTKKLAYDVATCHVSSPASLVVRPIFCGSPMLQNVCGSLKHLPTWRLLYYMASLSLRTDWLSFKKRRRLKRYKLIFRCFSHFSAETQKKFHWFRFMFPLVIRTFLFISCRAIKRN